MRRLLSVGDIEMALRSFRSDQVAVLRGMAALRGFDPDKLTVADYKRLMEEEASWDDVDPNSDGTYGRALRRIASKLSERN